MSKSQKPVQDERVAIEEKRYRSEALWIIETLLIVSIITKTHVLQLPFEEITGDWVLLILAVAYPFVRGLLSGGGEASQKASQSLGKIFSGSLAAAAAVAAIITLLSYQRYADKYQGLFDPFLLAVFGVAFLTMLICNVVIYGLVQLGSHRVQKRIDRELDQ